MKWPASGPGGICMEKTIRKNDCVMYTDDKGATVYGYVVDKHKKQGTCDVVDRDLCETVTLAQDRLTVVAPTSLSADQLRRILRYELPLAQLVRTIVPLDNFRVEESCAYSLDDMMACVRGLAAAHLDAEEFSTWLELVFHLLHFDYIPADTPQRDQTRILFDHAYPANDAAFAEDIFTTLADLYYAQPACGTDQGLNLPAIEEDLENYRADKPVRIHLWSRENLDNLFYAAGEHMGEGWTEEELVQARELIKSQAQEGSVYALQALAYACYGGSRLMACDWPASCDALTRLMDSETVSDLDKCIYANSLGAIYYYGRLGAPDYDKALRAFTLAAAGGIYDAMYKLSDMYAQGKGVAKNSQAATSLVRLVYDQCERRIKHGDYRSDFADAAMRMGKLAQEGYLNNDPYYYYTLADYAIRKRLPYHQQGDGEIYSGIQKELAKIRETRPLRTRSELTCDNFPPVVDELFRKYTCEVSVKRHKDDLRITVTRLPRPGQAAPKQVFECSPDDGYAALITGASFLAHNVKEAPNFGKKTHFRADGIDFDMTGGKSSRYSFCYHGQRVFSFSAKNFTRKFPQAHDDQDLTLFAQVRFAPGQTPVDCICDLPQAKAGDHVIVDMAGQEREAVVERVFRADPETLLMPDACYCHVVRPADQDPV